MLLERENAITLFESAAQRLSDGKGGVVLVSGEAGIGKTSLLEHIRSDLANEYNICWSGCDPLFTPRPFGPVYDLAIDFSYELLELLEAGAPSSKIFSQLYRSLEVLDQPVILVFEDAHWADHATVDLFKFLSRRISFVPCLLVISYRDDEVNDNHRLTSALNLFPSGHTSRIALAPLTEEAVGKLATGSQRDSSKLHQITAGNPFFITELLASQDSPENSIPASVRDAIKSRLVHLAKTELAFLETISLIPNSVSAQMIDLIFGSLGETCAMACVARKLLVADVNGNFKFRHELARLGTLAGVSVNRQTSLHSKIVVALEASQNKDQLAQLIHHSAGALDAERVLKYAPLAAQNAAKLGAHREAASYLGTALRFVEEAETELAAQLYEDWAYETALTLQIDDDVIEARRHAITLWRALGRKDKVGQNLRWLSRLHWYQGQAAKAEHFANEAIKILEDTPASSERAMAYSMRSQLDMLNNRMVDAVKWGHRALDMEKEHPNPEVRVHALTNVGSALVLHGDTSGEALLTEGLKLAIKHDFHEHAARVYTNYSDYCVRYKKLDAAEKLIENGITFDSSYDLDSWTYYLVGIQSQLRMEQGRLQDAETISAGVLELAQLTLLMQLPALTVLARVRTRMGSPDAHSYVSQCLENAFATDELQYIIPARLCAVEGAWLKGNEDEAYAQLKLLTELDASYLDHWQTGEMATWINRFGFDLSVSNDIELPQPYQLELDGEHQKAADLWESMKMPYNAATCFMQISDNSAPSALRKAYKSLDSMTAKATLNRLRNKAKKLGILSKLPRERRGPYKATRQHPLGLTGKEQEVLKFIVVGASNQDIASSLSRSQRTVENHVSSILSKLNVANRMEAMLRVQNEPWLSSDQD